MARNAGYNPINGSTASLFPGGGGQPLPPATGTGAASRPKQPGAGANPMASFRDMIAASYGAEAPPPAGAGGGPTATGMPSPPTAEPGGGGMGPVGEPKMKLPGIGTGPINDGPVRDSGEGPMGGAPGPFVMGPPPDPMMDASNGGFAGPAAGMGAPAGPGANAELINLLTSRMQGR